MNAIRVERLLDSLKVVVQKVPSEQVVKETADWHIRLSEIGNNPGNVTPGNIHQSMLQFAEKLLYTDMQLIKPDLSPWKPSHIAVCHIIGENRYSLAHYVFSMAEAAAREHDRKNPLIVSVELYQELDMSEYFNKPIVNGEFEEWKKRFFSKYHQVAALMFSSYFQRYFSTGPDKASCATKYLFVESPHWDDVLRHFGVE